MIKKTRDRPRFPTGYGIHTSPDGMLDWATVETALKKAPTYWLATATGAPHLTPIWGAWVADRLHIEGGSTTRWAKNLAANPVATAGIDVDDLQVMVEGVIAIVTPAPGLHDEIASQYAAKYPYRPEAGSFYQLRPKKVLAWSIATIDEFASTPTRFTFEEQT